MTPQQLIDLRGAGNAEKWLRKHGKWHLTPQEKLAEAVQAAADAIEEANQWLYSANAALEKMED